MASESDDETLRVVRLSTGFHSDVTSAENALLFLSNC